ncbi:multiheme c-type cytochrome [soil metagenome]
MSATDPHPPKAQSLRDRRGRVYTPAVGARLRPLLWIVLIGFALLGANGFYLASVTLLTWLKGAPQDTWFYMLMVALHLLLGFAILLPFLAFGFGHLFTSWKRPNKAAVRYGLILLASALVLLVSGLVLVRLEVPFGALGQLRFEVRDPTVREIGYWLHVGTPVLAIILYIRHRLAGPQIKWKYAKIWGSLVAVFVVAMGLLHTQDPRVLAAQGPREGARYFFPSEAKTADGNLIPADTLMMDEYCLKCHQDAYEGWFHSAHHFSSFNNKAYLFSVRETRQVAMERDGNTRAARWCAGCHDPVPFFSGQFDDPNYDDVNDPTAHAGITCTSCHSITHVNSTRGNADYTIEAPEHYPFAASDNPVLQWINNTLVKAKPELHKQTFLKPLHKTEEFCSTCHKVSMPFALNYYKDFLRGQNHYDPFLLSGVSGHGARSFYYPEVAKTNCAECHMDLIPSNDFGARDFDGTGGRKIHNHLFLGANTGLATFRGREDVAARHAEYLSKDKLRIDIFGLKAGGRIEDELIAPLRPEVPELEPGKNYLVEVVVRTLGVGHLFSQGTADSNEIWVELIARADGEIIGRSGGMDDDGTVDPFAHFINVYMLDRHGNRIDRRNPQDIFVPLYNHQIPPGAGQVVHFSLDVPEDIDGPIELEARVNYRKFDRKYMDHVFGDGEGPDLPVVLMARDTVALPLAGGTSAENEPSPIPLAKRWERWNDYGIGLLLEGGELGSQKGELRQAEQVFLVVANEYDRADGWVNLARVYQREGRIPDALNALEKAASHPEPAATWTINWLTGQINLRNGYLDEAIRSFESVLNSKVPERKFDFSKDYFIINELGLALDRRGRTYPVGSPERLADMRQAIARFRDTLALDSENVSAHYGLGQAYHEFSREAEGSLAIEPGSDPLSAEGLLELLEASADHLADPSERAASARDLAIGIRSFLAGPRPEFGSRIGPLLEIVQAMGPVFDQENDPMVLAEQARTLEVAHKALHDIFRPDETAEGRAMRIARASNPAADQNAQSIVIHPLNRPGAPGVARNEPVEKETSE